MGVNMIHATTLRPRFVTTHVRLNKHVASTLPNLHLRFSFLRISTCPNSHRTRGSDTLLHICYPSRAHTHTQLAPLLIARPHTLSVMSIPYHHISIILSLVYCTSYAFHNSHLQVCFTYAFSTFTSLHLSPEFRILLTHTPYHS